MEVSSRSRCGRLNLTEGHRVRALVYGIGHAIAFGILSFLEAKWRRTFGGVPV